MELVEKSNDIARWAHLSDEQQEVEIKQMNEEMVRQGQPAVSEEVWHWRMAQNLLGLSRYEQKKRESQAQLGLAGPSLDTTANPVKIDLAHTKPEDVREAAGLTTEGWKAFLVSCATSDNDGDFLTRNPHLEYHVEANQRGGRFIG